ncbi:Cytokine receptor common subunit beta [Heterocephalus glaber]|uniref:Cytokine receptor common subunit beta n=1 Tax=Heterocephalus glaber TaxID=10181 RepID=G5BAV8_HETGA|nr:Cytokine receptor common subunit beta [Heterocephalus glaber]
MALLPGPLLMALLALGWGTRVEGSEGTVPLQTLHCYNDYTSRIVCSWADTEAAGRLVNVTLHWRLNERCVIPYQGFSLDKNGYFSFQPDRLLHIQRTVTLAQQGFSLDKNGYFSFQPDRLLHIQRTVTLAQQGVHGGSVEAEKPAGSGLGADRYSYSEGDLEFEVVYKRLHESWENASTLHSSSSQVTLGPELLLPSSTYVARVRTRLAPHSSFSGRPSQWSREVHWDSQPGDKAQPQNLQCVFDGAHVLSCSWEVRSQVTSSVSFGLFYRPSPDAGEEECPQVQKEELDGLYTRQSCQIRVSSLRPHGQYMVAVRPRNEETFIKSSEHIQMAAPTLSMTKDGDRYTLHWEERNGRMTGPEIQVQHREDMATWEDSKTETLKNAHSMPLPPLQPATTYWARNGSAGLWLPDSMVAFVGRSAPHQGPGAGLFPELEGLCAVDHRDSEVSPLTTADPKVVCDPPSGSHSTPATTELPPEQPPSPQPGPPATQGRPEDQLATFDFNGPYLGSPHSCSLPDLAGRGPKPALPGPLEYLCLPLRGQVQLVPLAQVTGQGQAAHEECLPEPGTQASPFLEAGGGPAPPASEPRGQAQDPEVSPVVLPISSGGPEHLVLASGCVTTADLALTLSTGASSVSLASAPGLQNPCLCPGLPPTGPPTAPPPEKPGFEGYVDLPPTMGPLSTTPLGSPVPSAPSSPVLSPGEPQADVALLSPTPEGLLVLQQVEDYCLPSSIGACQFPSQARPSVWARGSSDELS